MHFSDNLAPPTSLDWKQKYNYFEIKFQGCERCTTEVVSKSLINEKVQKITKKCESLYNIYII